SRPFETDLGADERDPVEHDAPGKEIPYVVVDLQGFDRHHVLTGDIHRDVVEPDAEEQVAAETADRELTVQVLLGLPDGEPAQPVAEPGRLRDDEGKGDHTYHQRAHERDDLERAADEAHGHVPSEGLTDAEVNAEVTGLRFTVHDEPGNLIQLEPDVETHRSDRRVVAEAGPDVVLKVVEIEVPRVRPDVAAVEEDDARQVPPDRRTELGRKEQHRLPADRIPFAER